MSASIVGIARERGLLEFRTHDLRDWTHDKHRSTDDTPYGGGPGLVMKPEPIFEAVEAVQALEDDPGYVIFFTPAGRRFDQALAESLAEKERLVMVCGRYEGFDERVLTLADLAALDRRLRADRRRAAGDGRRGRGGAARTGGSRRRGFGGRRVVLGGTARVPAVHAPCGVSRDGASRRAAQRRPRQDRRVAPGTVGAQGPRSFDPTSWRRLRSRTASALSPEAS